MKVYLAARLDRRLDLAAYRDELAAEGIECTSTWLDETSTEDGQVHALIDVEDVKASDVLVAFSEEPVAFSDKRFASRGGRHVEFGLAVAWEKPIIVVGPRENVFHLLPSVTAVSSWFECKALLFEMAVAS